MSFNEVQQLLAFDPAFASFRFATLAELSHLYADFGIPDVNDYGSVINGTTANVPGARALQSYLGITYSIQVSGVSLFETGGFVGSPYLSQVNGFRSVYLGDVAIRDNVQTGTGPASFAYVATNLSSATVGTQYEGIGSWLVTSVPEPHSLVVLVFGMVMLFAVVSHMRSPSGSEIGGTSFDGTVVD